MAGAHRRTAAAVVAERPQLPLHVVVRPTFELEQPLALLVTSSSLRLCRYSHYAIASLGR